MESSPISLLHYIENAQENKENTILSYNIAENSKRVKRNEENSDLSQSINTSLLTSGSETLSYADNCFIFDSVFRFIKRSKRSRSIVISFCVLILHLSTIFLLHFGIVWTV
jgi:hypothetical protein